MDEILKSNIENCEAISEYIKQIQNILLRLCEEELKEVYEGLKK